MNKHLEVLNEESQLVGDYLYKTKINTDVPFTLRGHLETKTGIKCGAKASYATHLLATLNTEKINARINELRKEQALLLGLKDTEYGFYLKGNDMATAVADELEAVGVLQELLADGAFGKMNTYQYWALKDPSFKVNVTVLHKGNRDDAHSVETKKKAPIDIYLNYMEYSKLRCNLIDESALMSLLHKAGDNIKPTMFRGIDLPMEYTKEYAKYTAVKISIHTESGYWKPNYYQGFSNYLNKLVPSLEGVLTGVYETLYGTLQYNFLVPNERKQELLKYIVEEESLLAMLGKFNNKLTHKLNDVGQYDNPPRLTVAYKIEEVQEIMYTTYPLDKVEY